MSKKLEEIINDNDFEIFVLCKTIERNQFELDSFALVNLTAKEKQAFAIIKSDFKALHERYCTRCLTHLQRLRLREESSTYCSECDELFHLMIHANGFYDVAPGS